MCLNYLFKRATLLIAVFLHFQVASSQENYLQGYVIDKDGDTIRGFVDYRNWANNPEKISFKKNLGDNPIICTPVTIKSFSVYDEIYAGAIVSSDLSPLGTDELEYGREPIIKVDTVFLQSIVQGIKSLYYYKNTVGRELFYIYEDSVYKLLVYKKYLNNSDGLITISENKRYLNQIAVYLNDCQNIQKEFESLRYSRKSLEKLFLYYYKCTGAEFSFHKTEDKVIKEFGTVAGLTFNNLAFDPAYYYVIRNDFSTSVSYSVGVYADLILARNQGKWSWYNELAFSPYKVEDCNSLYMSENDYINYTTTFGYAYLKLNSMARFKYPIGKVFIFLNAGMSNGFAIHETNQVVVERKYYSSETTNEIKALYVTRIYEQGFIAGLGAKYDKFSFECRYEKGNGMSAMMNLNSTTTRYLFLFGYRF